MKSVVQAIVQVVVMDGEVALRAIWCQWCATRYPDRLFECGSLKRQRQDLVRILICVSLDVRR